MNRSMLVDLIKEVAGRIIKWSTVAQQSDRCGYIWATLPPGRSDEKISSERVRLIQQFGFRSKPPSGSEILVGNPRAGTINPVALGTDNLGYGPTDLEDGEVVEYGPAHTNGGVSCMRWKPSGEMTITTAEATIQIASTGQINITAKTAADVVVNGGTLRVARKTDPVGYLCIQTAVVSGTTVVTEAKWSATVLPPPYVCTAITIQDGAEHVKA